MELKSIEQESQLLIPSITLKNQVTPPQWALTERLLINQLNQAALEFVARYTRADGTLIWRQDWPGMDGSDDPYEGFMNLALLYTLGGSSELHELARKIWEGITWQWTEYGQVHREFDAYYDWMHHGEGYLYLYFLGLAGPATLKDRQRAARFAGMYIGEDEEAKNYDAQLKLIRSPITGSRGPQFELTAEDWVTHRGILDNYLAPYEDIPGVDFASGKCAWSNDEIYADIVRLMNERMTRGDVPLNLNATGLVTHAFLYSGDDKYRSWVLDYLAVWEERTRQNGGIIPDNVGLSGEIGQYNDGKWWGGYYGWRWPHGFMTIIEPLTNACMNAVLLTGDMGQLDLARNQLDENFALGKEVNGQWLVPYKYFDAGWADYRPAAPRYPVYLWTVSMADEDLNRIERIAKDHDWNEVIIPTVSGGDKKTGRDTKHYIGNTQPWFQYIRGLNPDYPQQILDANCKLVEQQLTKMRSEAGDPHNWITSYNEDDFSSIHAWQEMCPVYMESLVQLTLGGPMHISHGGLQHARVRYYDVEGKRPGLPESVAALVKELTDRSVTLELINIDLFAKRTLIIQAGTFGEHRFEEVHFLDEAGASVETSIVNNKWLVVELPAGTGASLQITMSRYVNSPSYDLPWADQEKNVLLEGRKYA
ncbi:hypothetical protein EHS13_06540 [Paenibacillus psychroresistens]|uniref:Uncharacterized protein n=1 Tax=Paenibacillus psychroresistens TaxID=1778678 RepID=A0A6B8RGR3_9BACL|nr:hypothetical protein [Paenibacillus psychroresistens]QGQ94566.1 hypothetical protein EHS13_06540 [Paenibacillus psychroresistens]